MPVTLSAPSSCSARPGAGLQRPWPRWRPLHQGEGGKSSVYLLLLLQCLASYPLGRYVQSAWKMRTAEQNHSKPSHFLMPPALMAYLGPRPPIRGDRACIEVTTEVATSKNSGRQPRSFPKQVSGAMTRGHGEMTRGHRAMTRGHGEMTRGGDWTTGQQGVHTRPSTRWRASGLINSGSINFPSFTQQTCSRKCQS